MKNTLPVLLLKNLILLPNQEVKLELNNKLSKEVVFLSKKTFHNELLVMPLKDQMEEMPEVSDLPNIAVVAKVKSCIELPNGNLRVTLRGLFRASIKKLSNDSKQTDMLKCYYEKIKLSPLEKVESLALKRKISEFLQKYVSHEGVSNSILNVIKDVHDLNKFTDLIASFLPLSFVRKLSYIEEVDASIRGNMLLEDLYFELEVLKLDQKLENKLQNSLEESQREYILKEKLKEIEEELGKTDDKKSCIEFYYCELENLHIQNKKIVEKIKNEIHKLEYMSDVSPEVSGVRSYLDWMFSLPWDKRSVDEVDVEKIKRALDMTHYGMEEVKNKILEYIAAKNRSKEIETPILCLVGPSGVGKTTLAKSIATSLHKEFYKISVGGLNDSSLLTGHRRTYLGSAPGKIMEGLKKCGVKNPLFLIDEVDKMVHDYKGDPASTLLEILDKNQNKTFVDYYIEEEFDLSEVLFILTANSKEDIPEPLKDRLEIIELSSYTTLEKVMIAKKYLLPKIFKQHKISSKNVKFLENTLRDIVLYYTKEAGVRELERLLTSIIRKLILKNHLENVIITKEKLVDLLSRPKYEKVSLKQEREVGIVNALAVNQHFGFLTPIEVCMYEGKGKLQKTGSLEKGVEESIKVAMGYLKIHHDLLQIDFQVFKEFDFHIHFLNTSYKKDGASAGVSITTAFLSAIKNISIPKNVAMTGEMTLNGYILPIGGLKEKLIASFNEGIKKVFIPKDNHIDLLSVPKEVQEKLEIIEVYKYEEIYHHLFR